MEGFKILETITDNVEYNIWTVLSIILGFTLIFLELRLFVTSGEVINLVW